MCRAYPCGHASMCEDCAKQVLAQNRQCPLCRQHISHIGSRVSLDQTFDFEQTFCLTLAQPLEQGLQISSPAKAPVGQDVNPDELKCLETIGRGCSSYVQKAVHVPSGTPLAIKVINLYDKAKRDQLLQEINTLYFADCPRSIMSHFTTTHLIIFYVFYSLIRFHGAFFKDSAISICLEYMDHGCLLDVVKRCGVIPENILAAVTFQVGIRLQNALPLTCP